MTFEDDEIVATPEEAERLRQENTKKEGKNSIEKPTTSPSSYDSDVSDDMYACIDDD